MKMNIFPKYIKIYKKNIIKYQPIQTQINSKTLNKKVRFNLFLCN